MFPQQRSFVPEERQQQQPVLPTLSSHHPSLDAQGSSKMQINLSVYRPHEGLWGLDLYSRWTIEQWGTALIQYNIKEGCCGIVRNITKQLLKGYIFALTDWKCRGDIRRPRPMIPKSDKKVDILSTLVHSQLAKIAIYSYSCLSIYGALIGQHCQCSFSAFTRA